MHSKKQPRISARKTGRPGFFRPFIMAVLALSFCASQAPARQNPAMGALDGMVTSVGDGEHLTISNSGKELRVRLYGVAAPVITKISRNDPRLSQPGQHYAGRAFMELAKKVLNKQTRLEIMYLDRHDRAVAVVYVDGRNINLEMIAEGWAWAAQRNRHKLPAEYGLAEEQARSRKAGLWTEENPIPPWVFKKRRGVQNLDSW